jgi:hypothetical protein
MMHDEGNDVKLKDRIVKPCPFESELVVEFYRRGISKNILESIPRVIYLQGG